jgi:nitronate monooxygenase
VSSLVTPVSGLLGVRYPVVQAPMAFVAPPSLAAAVSEAGALGSVAGGGLSPDELRAAIGEVRAATSASFAVNLFAPPHLGEGVLDVVLDERPAVLSFTFGIVDPTPLREAGIVTVGTGTTVDEARALEDAGVQAVVAQGAEAGGHRGTFLRPVTESLVPLEELVPACAAAVSVPVLAAGGIVDGAGIARALELGAQGAWLGTAFLFTPECRTPPAWLDALRRYETVVTDAYSGRAARAARTPFLETLIEGPPPLPFPQQRRVVEALPNAERFYLGGTGARRARELPAAALVRALVTEAGFAGESGG